MKLTHIVTRNILLSGTQEQVQRFYLMVILYFVKLYQINTFIYFPNLCHEFLRGRNHQSNETQIITDCKSGDAAADRVLAWHTAKTKFYSF